MIRSKSLALSLAVTLAFAACQSESTPPTDTSANTATANGGYALDESTLPTVVSFDAADLDPATPACDDFDGYVSGQRSEERRVGKKGCSKCSSRWSPVPSNKNQ